MVFLGVAVWASEDEPISCARTLLESVEQPAANTRKAAIDAANKNRFITCLTYSERRQPKNLRDFDRRPRLPRAADVLKSRHRVGKRSSASAPFLAWPRQITTLKSALQFPRSARRINAKWQGGNELRTTGSDHLE